LYDNGPGHEYYSCIEARQEVDKPIKHADGSTTLSITDYIQPCEYNNIGWPIKARYFDPQSAWGSWYPDALVRWALFLNTLFWILIVLIILSLVRHFKKKNVQNTST
jgi:hypothetical protein